jgi:O-antigen/teichoic acid export membrane protein
MAAAVTMSLTLGGLLDFGSNSLWVRELARPVASVHDIPSRFWTKCFVYGAGGMCATLVLVKIGAPGFTIAAAWLGVSTASTTSLGVFARAALRSERVGYALVAERATGLAIFLVLAGAGVHAVTALPVALLLASMLSGIVMWHLVPRMHRPVMRRIRFKNPWQGALHFGTAAVASALQGLDVAVLTAAGGATQAGIYASVGRWTQPMSLLSGAFSATAAPFFASAKTARVALLEAKRASWLLYAASAGCLTVFAIAPWLVPSLLGEPYAGAIPVLQLLAIGTLVVCWNQPMATLLQARGRDRAVALVRLGGSTAFLIAVWRFGPEHGAIGAAMCFVTLQAFIFSSLALVIARQAAASKRRLRTKVGRGSV